MLQVGNDAIALHWTPIGDPVMGGQSTGAVHAAGPGIFLFSGTVSLAHGGGFASVRAMFPPADLSAFGGLSLCVQGDGRDYKLGLVTRDGRDVPVHQQSFHARAGVWQTLHLPFDAFAAHRRGRPTPEADPMERSHVCGIGLYTAGREPGPFRLLWRDLAAVS